AVLVAAGAVEAVRRDLPTPLMNLAVVAVAALGLAFLGLGAYDLLTPARVIDGLVLRVRVQVHNNRTGKHVSWFLAVDVGPGDRVRALRFEDDPGPVQGGWVEAEVTPLLRYVRALHRRPRPRR